MKMSMYVVCLLHDVLSYHVPKCRTEIAPFEEGCGVKICFDEDTFDSTNVQIDLKVLFSLIVMLYFHLN